MKNCIQCKAEFVPARKEQVYCSKACASVSKGSMRKGMKTGKRKNWNYTKTMNRDGYLVMYAGHHPYAEGRKMIAEHIMIMELHIQRRIAKGECVHHKNGVKTDNRLKNLELQNHSKHSKDHNVEIARTRKRARGRFA